MRASTAVAVALITVLAGATARAQTIIDTCGQTLDGDGVLMADLDCSAAALPSITFTQNATLRLNGYTITGEVLSQAAKFEVIGPGTITGPGYGILGEPTLAAVHGSKVTVQSVNVSDNELEGISVVAGGHRVSAVVIDSSVTGNGRRGIWAVATAICAKLGCDPAEKVLVEGSIVSGNAASGIEASSIDVRSSVIASNGLHGIYLHNKSVNRKLRLSDSEVSDNGDSGIYVHTVSRARLLIKSSSISRNATGINDQSWFHMSMKLKGASLDANGIGIRSDMTLVANQTPRKKLRILDSTIVNSERGGIRATYNETFVTLKRTMVANSGGAAECGVIASCADLDTDVLATLKPGAVCGTSHVYSSGIPGTSWGICTND